MGALDGIRVLDFSIIVQGPQCGAMLHDLGADVVKIEMPVTGDVARWILAKPDDPRGNFFTACNRGKRSITLDLHNAAAVGVAKRLAATADVVISNFAPGTMDRFGLGYEDLAAINPRIVYGAASAMGPVGSEASRKGADLTGQSEGGLILTTGNDGEAPTPIAAVLADHSGSQNLTTGILAALFARERTGRGQKVEVSLLGAMVWAQAAEYSHYLIAGEVHGRSNRGHPMIRGVYGMFQTADGWISMVGVPPDLWSSFCHDIERPDLIEHALYGKGRLTEAQRRQMFTELAPAFRALPTATLVERFRRSGQRFARVRDYAEVAADPHTYDNGYLVRGEHPRFGPVTVVGSPLRMSDTPTVPGISTPELGEHTEEVLLEAGYTWEEIAKLREEGAW